MKKVFLIALFSVSFHLWGVSIGKLNKSNPAELVIESENLIDLDIAFEKYSFFTNNIGGKYFATPNKQIGDNIKEYANDAGLFESKTDLFKHLKQYFGITYFPQKNKYKYFVIKKNDGKVFLIVPRNTKSDEFLLYWFEVVLDQKALNNYDKLTKDYEFLRNQYISNSVEIENCKKPYVEVLRQIPYTEYRSVRKSRTVTKFRKKHTSSGDFQEPYSETEYYWEKEPYTTHKTEKYTEPNPKYNPSMAAELENKNIEILDKLEKIKKQVKNNCLYNFTYYKGNMVPDK